MGRPIIGSKKSTRIGIRLDDETLEKLNSYCEKKSLSKSDVIRQALNEYFK
ncbi:ribbon-helix-helix protein, CopG family [uncultured Dubosiella sp.]|uniref:ribbon-helix-helix protein, CopG family n=1 Tax=uncultured Dubosiella sp. TaxID=1937011 RepID=UPI0032B24E98